MNCVGHGIYLSLKGVPISCLWVPDRDHNPKDPSSQTQGIFPKAIPTLPSVETTYTPYVGSSESPG